MGGYLSCYKKTEQKSVGSEAPRGVKARARKKPRVSEDFWSTSTIDMDNSTFPSKGSGSSISTSNHPLDSPSEFVNQGFVLWNQSRQRWVGKTRSEKDAQPNRDPKINWNATYDSLLGSNKPFPHPVPLSEMVDFLLDVWDQEGLYD